MKEREQREKDGKPMRPQGQRDTKNNKRKNDEYGRDTTKDEAENLGLNFRAGRPTFKNNKKKEEDAQPKEEGVDT